MHLGSRASEGDSESHSAALRTSKFRMTTVRCVLMNPSVLSVHASGIHTVSKAALPSIKLVDGFGVEGDAHSGATVKHLSRVRRDATKPNLRQVHLIHAELLDELREKGFDVEPGMMGENVTTEGIDLLSLPTGSHLKIGDRAVVELTGLRNPCTQLDGLIPGLMNAVLDRDADGGLISKIGVMAIVVADGEVRSGDKISIELPAGERLPLTPV